MSPRHPYPRSVAVMHLSSLRPTPTRRWFATGREVIFVLATFGLYLQVRRFTSAELGSAVGNAGRVVSWERSLGIYRELDVQRFALDRQWLIEILDHYY